jgi:hypothetical protein
MQLTAVDTRFACCCCCCCRAARVQLFAAFAVVFLFSRVVLFPYVVLKW